MSNAISKVDLSVKLNLPEEKTNELLTAAEIALDLSDYTPHEQKLTEVLKLMGGQVKTYSQAMAKHKENHAIKTKGDRPLPDLVPHEGAISIATKILDGTGLREALDQDAEAYADGLAEAVARAPFDGVTKRAEQIAQQAEAAEAYGAQVLDAKVTGKLNDPDFINRIVADIQKKRGASK